MVLGGTSGLGFATAEALVAAGARVAVAGRNADKAAAAAERLGDAATGAAVDAADTDAVAAFFDGLAAVDHVVSFTGEQPSGAVADTDHATFARAIDARVWAARNACVAAAPRMADGGSFVFCSGVSSFRPRAGRSAGAVATAAVESFVRAMAVELAPLRVNAVCPGAFDTEVLRRALGDQREAIVERYRAEVPLGRIGNPDEMAHAVEFLLTNTYTTGVTLRVDGGFALT